MADPNFAIEANELHDLLLNPPTIVRERAVALIQSSLNAAFSVGKVAGIDSALAIFNPPKGPPRAPDAAEDETKF